MKPTRISTFRLPPELAEEVDLAARIEGVPVSEFVRRSLRNEVDRLRADQEFRARLQDRITADQRLLDRLSKGAPE